MSIGESAVKTGRGYPAASSLFLGCSPDDVRDNGADCLADSGQSCLGNYKERNLSGYLAGAFLSSVPHNPTRNPADS